LKNKKLIVLLF